jgi:pre-rRNA-processing protein TSR3
MIPKTLILRHRRENLKKCSLQPLLGHPDFLFLTYPKDPLPNLSRYVLLKMGAPLLTVEDREKGIFLIDGTWRLASVMERRCIPVEERSLPCYFRTVYPRRQTLCPEPEQGLASIEALFLAYSILQRPVEGLLDRYFWRDLFLKTNCFYD